MGTRGLKLRSVLWQQVCLTRCTTVQPHPVQFFKWLVFYISVLGYFFLQEYCSDPLQVFLGLECGTLFLQALYSLWSPWHKLLVENSWSCRVDLVLAGRCWQLPSGSTQQGPGGDSYSLSPLRGREAEDYWVFGWWMMKPWVRDRIIEQKFMPSCGWISYGGFYFFRIFIS